MQRQNIHGAKKQQILVYTKSKKYITNITVFVL